MQQNFNHQMSKIEELQGLLHEDKQLQYLNDLRSYANSSKIEVEQLLINTVLAKVGVSTEIHAHWFNRMGTFVASPNGKTFECINIPATTNNAKIIEALSFAILQHLGLKVSNKKTKSAQGEFFRLHIACDSTTACVQGDIEKVLKHCSEITLDEFQKWSLVYEKNNLADLKNTECWNFESKIIRDFFDVKNLSLKAKYAHYYEREQDDTIDLDLQKNEIRYLIKRQTNLSVDVRTQLRGPLATVTERLCKMVMDVGDEDEDVNDSDKELNEESKCGIFCRETILDVIETIMTKCNIGTEFRVCIIGIYNVISVCRLIREFGEHCNGATKICITVVDVLHEKLVDLENLLSTCSIQNCQILYKCCNFLFDKNADYQNFNCVICLLNASSSHLFAIKFILLQMYCRKEQSGLQLVLSSKKIIEDANSAFQDASFRPNAISAKLFCAAPTFGYDIGALEYQLRDLYSIVRIREIFPAAKDIDEENREVWRTIKFHVQKEMSQWGHDSKVIEKILDPLNFACLKKTSDFVGLETAFQISGGSSKRILVVAQIKEYLHEQLHDSDARKLLAMQVDSMQTATAKNLVSKLDSRFIGVFLNMQRTIRNTFVDIANCCGYFIELTINEREMKDKCFATISRIRESKSNIPNDCEVLRELTYLFVYKKLQKESTLKSWSTQYFSIDTEQLSNLDEAHFASNTEQLSNQDEAHKNAAPVTCTGTKCLLVLPLSRSEESFEAPLNAFEITDQEIIAEFVDGTDSLSKSQMAKLNTRNTKDLRESWLGSVIISFFAQILQREDRSIAIVDDIFMKDLLSGNQTAVRTARTKKFNTKPRILVIINIDNSHWTFILMDRNQGTVSYFDGSSEMPNQFDGNKYTEALIELMTNKEVWGVDIQNEFKILNIPHFVQKDGFNCGVLLCVMMDYIVHNEVMQQQIIPLETLNKLRVKLACSIVFSPLNRKTQMNSSSAQMVEDEKNSATTIAATATAITAKTDENISQKSNNICNKISENVKEGNLGEGIATVGDIAATFSTTAAAADDDDTISAGDIGSIKGKEEKKKKKAKKRKKETSKAAEDSVSECSNDADIAEDTTAAAAAASSAADTISVGDIGSINEKQEEKKKKKKKAKEGKKETSKAAEDSVSECSNDADIAENTTAAAAAASSAADTISVGANEKQEKKKKKKKKAKEGKKETSKTAEDSVSECSNDADIAEDTTAAAAAASSAADTISVGDIGSISKKQEEKMTKKRKKLKEESNSAESGRKTTIPMRHM